MANSKLPSDPEEFYDLVQQGGLDNETLIEELRQHGGSEESHGGITEICEICRYIWDQDNSTIQEFFVNSHSNSVDAAVIELAISQISHWAWENYAYDAYLSIALNPNSSSDTVDQAFEFMEDYRTYFAFMQSSDEYIAEILRKIARHPLSAGSESSWIRHNHYMYSEAGWEGHDEVDDEEDSVDVCELCKKLYKDSQSVGPTNL